MHSKNSIKIISSFPLNPPFFPILNSDFFLDDLQMGQLSSDLSYAELKYSHEKSSDYDSFFTMFLMRCIAFSSLIVWKTPKISRINPITTNKKL